MTEASGFSHAIDLEPNLIAARVDGGRIAENILQFARLLRASGMPVGPDSVVRATQAVLVAGIESPHILYWTLHATFVTRPQQREIFDQAFYLFWKDPGFLDQMMSLMLPQMRRDSEEASQKQLARRLQESLLPSREPPQRPREENLEIDARDTFSTSQVLRTKDFEQMSAAELAAARTAIRRMALTMQEIPTRRLERARGRAERVDLRAVLREVAAKGPDFLVPRYRQRRWRRPPLVVLCDISGSMDTYARIFLHFLYALTNARDRVHCFLFGTQLSNITRTLRNRDPDIAIAKVAADVTDWSGGTRIGESLADFNRTWARRVLGQNATVLLFTDGLDRVGGEGIAKAARRLKASSRRLVWLNPLLRYDGYQPLAAGARELRPNVTELRACHNLASLADLAKALGDGPAPATRRR